MDGITATDHPEKDAAYYDGVYLKGYDAAGRYAILYSRAYDLLMGIPNPAVLEIGCGTGVFGSMIMGANIERGENVVKYRGFDYSKEGVEIAKRSSMHPEAFHYANAYSPLSYEPPDYNVAVALETFEHLDDLCILSHLPKGVNVIASVPNYDDVAHLRTYHSPQAIEDYYAPILTVKAVLRLGTGVYMADWVEQSIFLFVGETR